VNEYRERDQNSKIGGRPGLIQGAGVTDVEKLETERLYFLFQFSEESYPDDMKYETYPRHTRLRLARFMSSADSVRSA
jgi:hypothetical protein